MSSAYSNSPHYSTPGLRFFGTSALRKSIIFPQACFPAVSFSRRTLCTRSLRNRTGSGTPMAQPKGPCLEPPAMAQARPGAPPTGQLRRAPARFRSFGMLSGSNSLDALDRCDAAPGPEAARQSPPMLRSAQWTVHNTNHWGAVRPNMIPGRSGFQLCRSCQMRR
jgi:hypothetical protein